MDQNTRFQHPARPVFLAMGGNQPSWVGDPKATIDAAIAALSAAGAETLTISKYYETPAFPAGSGPNYVNAVIAVTWGDSAPALLDLCHAVEADHGRTRTHRWEARVLDIDLLCFGDLVAPDLATYRHWVDLPLTDQMQLTPETLILPHPRLQDRAFVMIPLAEIAPDWVHPVLGKTAADMRDALPSDTKIGIKPLN